MNFSEQIKKIRKEEQLTQEQFAQKLNVTRQAISNWENDKNLPDIEMLITISDVFHVSLDTLIKGEKEMNNMMEKVIRDGSENRRAKYNMVNVLVGAFFLLLGIILLVIKANSVEYLDAEGFLHENFYLLPLGFLCLFCGLISFATAGIRSLIARLHKHE